jgi:hypothetical protein
LTTKVAEVRYDTNESSTRPWRYRSSIECGNSAGLGRDVLFGKGQHTGTMAWPLSHHTRAHSQAKYRQVDANSRHKQWDQESWRVREWSLSQLSDDDFARELSKEETCARAKCQPVRTRVISRHLPQSTDSQTRNANSIMCCPANMTEYGLRTQMAHNAVKMAMGPFCA